MQRGELPIRDPNQKRSALVEDTFHHRGETIRLVNEGLSDPAKAASDELIAAVSTLLTIEVSRSSPSFRSCLTPADRIRQPRLSEDPSGRSATDDWTPQELCRCASGCSVPNIMVRQPQNHC